MDALSCPFTLVPNEAGESPKTSHLGLSLLFQSPFRALFVLLLNLVA
jgi:hypothetical protein